MRKFLYLVLFNLVICLGAQAQLASPVALDNPHLIKNIGKDIFILEDKGDSLLVTDVAKGKYDADFRQNQTLLPDLKMSQSTVWVKFSLQNVLAKDWYLEIGNPNLDSVSLYSINKLGVPIAYDFNDTDEKIVYNSSGIYIPLKIKPKEKRVFLLKIKSNSPVRFPLAVATLSNYIEEDAAGYISSGLFYGLLLLMVVSSLFLFRTVNDSIYLYFIFFVICNGLAQAFLDGDIYMWFGISLAQYLGAHHAFMPSMAMLSSLLFAVEYLKTKENAAHMHRGLLAIEALFAITILCDLFVNTFIAYEIMLLASMVNAIYLFMISVSIYRKNYKPAKYFVIAWSFFLLRVLLQVSMDMGIAPGVGFMSSFNAFLIVVTFMILSFALSDKINAFKVETESAEGKMVKALRDNEKLIRRQNEMLEQKVKERTAELQKTMTDLESAQEQLIQSEKMAALGQMTAGVAHEIQNPLNFVNNFSDLSLDLIKDLKEEGDEVERNELLDSLEQNVSKIHHHGKRAEGIVKSMLEHSRGASVDEKASVSINKMLDEYVLLSYQQSQKNNPDFECTVYKELDEKLPNATINQQDVGRVFINLFNNAFYEMHKYKTSHPEYIPALGLFTTSANGKITIRIKDNGPGIPEENQKRIFEPFFTTKPTGEGTGLGLSLSYDIIVKGHNGEMKLESKPGKGAEFIITIPVA
ncbi:MAG: ATP-binding protein [Bacteroidetes bacterium]|nr:ATP-binding protein [Bacteroidota bacterium]